MEVKEILSSYILATNTHDFKNVSKYIAEDAIYWFTTNKYKNIKSIKDYFENTWKLIKNEKYSISDVNWILLDENGAACIYIYHWQGIYNGDLIEGKGHATNIFKRINGEWKIVHEHLSPLT